MWDRLPPQHHVLKAQMRAFAERHVVPTYRACDAENRVPEDSHRAAREAGLLTLGFPEALGGGGLGQAAMVIAGEELSAVCGPTAFSIGFNHGALRPLLFAGTPDQQARFVAPLLHRGGYASICMTEPDRSGSNLITAGTTATRTDAGWVIEGTKTMIGNASLADLFIVFADTWVDGKRRGPSWFVVPRSAAVHVGPNPSKLGFRALPTCDVRFDAAIVPEAHLVGRVGWGDPILRDALDFMRLGGSAVILGIVTGALRQVVPWVETRIVFPDEPLMNKSHVQITLGRIYGELLTLRTLLWDTAERFDRGEAYGTQAATLKLRASEFGLAAMNEIVQLFGWRGVHPDLDIEKRLRDVRMTTIWEGSSEILAMQLFQRVRQSSHDDQAF